MKVLVACEFSGIVREAFRKRGHDAWSCDLLPTEQEGNHIQGNVLDILNDGWDLMIAHPPCTYLAVSGLHWNKKYPERKIKTENSLDFVKLLLNAPINKIALENPVGCISSRIRKPEQIIQPYQFGDNASKKTCLWLKNLPKLKPTLYIEPRMVNGKKRWGNQDDKGQNKLMVDGKWIGFNDHRTPHLRSVTYQGIADAMAEQWGQQVTGEK